MGGLLTMLPYWGSNRLLCYGTTVSQWCDDVADDVMVAAKQPHE